MMNHPPAGTGYSRRDAMRQMALALGLSLSAGSLSALAASLGAPRDMSHSSKTFLTQEQLALVRQIGELILPATDTPGAIAAGVHDFINRFVSSCATQTEREQLVRGLQRIEAVATARARKPFLALSETQQLKLLAQMELTQEEFNAEDRGDFKYLKGLVLLGYYTSEIGATQELRYDAVPGGFKGEVKFSKVGRAWSLVPLP